jgi:hypothetical protein
MREKLIQFYHPEEVFFEKLWEDAIIIPDANILLNLYRYDEKTRTEFLEILDKLKERLWVPHQVALEYQKNRINEIINQREKLHTAKKIFIDSKKELTKDINDYAKKYPHFDTSPILEPVKSAYDSSIAEIDRIIEQDPDLFQKDPIRESLTQIFEKRVGHRYPQLRERELFSDAERRFELEIPPGYEDYRTKPGIRKFGDFILWIQMLDHAKETKKSIIFITDDKKEDWWWIHNRRTIGPRPELIEEINERAKVSFHMYNSRGFIEWASEYIEQHISPETIQEVENIQKERESRLYSTESLLDIKYPMLTKEQYEEWRKSLFTGFDPDKLNVGKIPLIWTDVSGYKIIANGIEERLKSIPRPKKEIPEEPKAEENSD